MIALAYFVLAVLASPFKSKSRLEAENAALRHQLIVLRRKVRGRAQLTNGDRWFFIQLYRWFPSILEALTIIRPETLVRWHRVGFRFYWCWKSRTRGGRPQIETDLRGLIRRMSIETRFGEHRVFMASCSSLGLRSLNRVLPSTWSSGEDRPARDGALSCVIMLQTLPPWTCLLSRPLASTCSMPSSSCGSIGGTSSGSTSQPTRQRSGLHVRSPRPFLGTR